MEDLEKILSEMDKLGKAQEADNIGFNQWHMIWKLQCKERVRNFIFVCRFAQFQSVLSYIVPSSGREIPSAASLPAPFHWNPQCPLAAAHHFAQQSPVRPTRQMGKPPDVSGQVK